MRIDPSSGGRRLLFLRPASIAAALTCVALALAVGCRHETSSSPATSTALEPVPLGSTIKTMEEVETLSEIVANRLIEFSDHVRKRDFASAAKYLTPDFRGTSFTAFGPGKIEGTPESLALGVTKHSFQGEGEGASGVDRAAFVASLETTFAPLESIDYVFFKTRGAEFEADKSRALLRMTTQVIGNSASGPYALYAWAHAEVVRRAPASEGSASAGGSAEPMWTLRRFIIDRMQTMTRPAPIFTEVATAAGVASRGPRLGTPGNDKFYWRGAISDDVDGDGLFDVFTSTSTRVWLYRNRGDGTFEDITERSGIDAPPGVTGPLFLDWDRDGHLDLFLGYVGWKVDGVPHGEALRLYRGDGKGGFTDVTEAAGIADTYINAFSTCAADVDNDGFLDIFVCNYHRLDAVYPNSWYRATNGSPNLLLHNQGGKRFVDIAAQAGLAGQDWSYAATFADFDADGDQDLYVANDYGDNGLFVNQGGLTFVDEAAKRGVLDTGNGMGATWGDLDNDGRLDLYVSNMSSSAGNRILKRFSSPAKPAEGSRPAGGGKPGISDAEEVLLKLAAGNTIFRQTKDGTFEKMPKSNGGVGASWAWSPALLDIDLDGLLDV